MSHGQSIPRVLIIDDLFGRTLPEDRNEERASLCAQFLLRDVTGDETDKQPGPKIKHPIADAIFYRGQQPKCARPGDNVENDLAGTMQTIREGWIDWRPDRPRWAMVLLDLCFYTGTVLEATTGRAAGLPEGQPSDDDPAQYFGITVIREIHREFPELPVVILSSKPRESVSREFSRFGALAFLPRAAADAPELLRRYIQEHGLIPDDAGEIIGHSKPLLLALRQARKAADLRNVLVRGPRGGGKELLARYINRHGSGGSPRKLIVVDSGSLSPHLYASELFGHKKGAFTGAMADRVGRIVEANGGDLFLDEIGNMPPDVQVGLLRVLEERVVTPLGGASQKVDVRFISATNEDIEAKAATGGFREDLLDRLRAGGTVFLRPLTERPEDIDDLVEHFVREAERKTPGAMTRRIEPDALQRLRTYAWPGNVRELRSCIFNAVRDYPHVEHLVPVHLHLEEGQLDVPIPRAGVPLASVPAHAPSAESLAERERHLTLDELLAIMERCPVANLPPTEIVGRLPQLQAACGRLVAHLLLGGLLATRRVTPSEPAGEILIQPAVKLITGDKAVTAVKAADHIKRILSAGPDAERLALTDPILHEAYAVALRLRPRGKK